MCLMSAIRAATLNRSLNKEQSSLLHQSECVRQNDEAPEAATHFLSISLSLHSLTSLIHSVYALSLTSHSYFVMQVCESK